MSNSTGSTPDRSAAPLRRRRLGRYAFKLWLPIVSVAMFVTSAEFICRALHLTERLHADFHFYVERIDNDLRQEYIVEDAVLMWSLLPHYPPGLDSINEYGFYDQDYPKEKGPHVFRIVCLGDSSTFGVGGIDYATTYHARLESRLDDAMYRSGIRTEVINAGVPGYTTAQCLAMYEYKVRDFRPDVVTLYAGVNDPIRRYRLCDQDLLRTDVPLWVREFTNSVLLRLDCYRVLRRLMLGRPDLDEGEQAAAVPRVSLDQFRENIERLNELCTRDGAHLVVISPPIRKENPTFPERSRDMVEYRRVLEETCQRLAIPVVRIPEMTEASPAPTARYFVDWVHPNEKGHALIANRLFKCLQREGLLPKPLQAAITQNRE